MFELVLHAVAALRTAYLADQQASDEALVAGALAVIDARDVSQVAKDNARKPGAMRLVRAALWCLRHDSKDIRQGWAGTGQANADQFDQKSAERLDAVLAGFELK